MSARPHVHCVMFIQGEEEEEESSEEMEEEEMNEVGKGGKEGSKWDGEVRVVGRWEKRFLVIF